MSLKIAVLVKQVPDHEAIVQLKSDRELDIEERYVCSFFDEVAIEAALNIKKDNPETEIFALSAGGRRAVDALRRAVAMGIDNVEHIGDETLETVDNYYTARVLAARLKTQQPGLIICGKQAGDDDAAAVGPMVAALLNIPHASAVVSLEMAAGTGRIKIGREAEGEVQYFESGFPLLVTAEKGLAEPHVPVVMRVMKAMKTQAAHIPIEELGLADIEPGGRVRRLRYAAPPERPPVTMIEQPFPENVVELINHLRQGGVV
ncbi:MAG: electron transfer flavoprotein subunit beta/FixA family protein [Candidatus Aminicenantes bacterium]|nr:electron transfer flavoprotein subunit beta/FixA family protein [Candidatus Aminicenantes bacterium]